MIVQISVAHKQYSLKASRNSSAVNLSIAEAPGNPQCSFPGNTYARAIGAEPDLEVPILDDGTGNRATAQFAADMVTYSNVISRA
jgi:hypothetical protein